jgi:hypothetical protein
MGIASRVRTCGVGPPVLTNLCLANCVPKNRATSQTELLGTYCTEAQADLVHAHERGGPRRPERASRASPATGNHTAAAWYIGGCGVLLEVGYPMALGDQQVTVLVDHLLSSSSAQRLRPTERGPRPRAVDVARTPEGC